MALHMPCGATSSGALDSLMAGQMMVLPNPQQSVSQAGAPLAPGFAPGFAPAVARGDLVGLYLHIPFCEKKCPYCDFNTYAGLNASFDETVDALCLEIERWAEPLRQRTVGTIFLGGGTPTVLSAQQLERLFATVRRCLTLAPDAEITSEANPGTVDRDKFGALRSLGVNRLSLGVQSFDAEELRFLGRIHSVDDVYRAVEAARAAGFDNLNLDFIFGLPQQAPETFARTLDHALALQPEHLSLYSLIVEENTPLHHWVESGAVAAPSDDLAADLYELTMARLAAAGYAHYEISNWARLAPGEAGGGALAPLLPQRASRHNLLYWLNGEFLGVGPGAHSHLRSAGSPRTSRRWGNRKPVPGYVRRMQNGASVEAFAEEADAATAMGETMMVGLRLVHHGVEHEHFRTLHGRDLRDVYASEIASLTRQGLIICDEARIRLSARGLLVGNQVFAHFLPDPDEAPTPSDAPAASPATHALPAS